jgi:CBS domain-containing protein
MDDREFLATVPPWDALPRGGLDALAPLFERRAMRAGDTLFAPGERLDGLHVVRAGLVRVSDADGTPLALVGPGGSFGERGLLADGYAPTRATAMEDGAVLVLPAGRFRALVEADEALRAHFEGAAAGWRRRAARPASLAETRVAELMSRDPATVPPGASIAEAARLMRERGIGSLLVAEGGRLLGILTLRDLAHRVLAGEMDARGPVAAAMTPDPVTLPPDAIGSDVLHVMVERGIGHLPVVGPRGLEGIVTQTDLTRFHAESSADLVGDAAQAPDAAALAGVTARLPAMLARLVGAGHRHEVVTRLVTDVADAVTRRLLALGQAGLGPPPVPFLWLACGSQGRREQTGVSDQDNCLILDDAAEPAHEAYFADLARFVCAGLDRCGYVFCPGDMMATNPRWRQPLRVWRRYFRGWIDRPDGEAQMLASVMFDLRPIGGEVSLHAGLQAETLEAASRNSIFVAHMVANSLKHTPPLGLLRGLATLRTGEHRNTIDMKLGGVIPVVDLGRVYALRGRLPAINTRARIEAAMAAGVISEAGGRDLLDAYDTIADARLAHQARQVREGARPDNFLPPAALSEFERNHLREAFVVVRRMQAAATQGQRVP